MTQIRPLREQQKFARPSRLKLFTRENERTSFDRVLDQGLFAVDSGRARRIGHPVALRSQGTACQVILAHWSLHHAGLESQVLGGAKQFDIREQLPDGANKWRSCDPSAGKS